MERGTSATPGQPPQRSGTPEGFSQSQTVPGSEDGTTPPGWQAMKPPFPGVRSCLAHPRLFTENPSGVETVDPGTDLRADYYWVKTGF